ncbi:hypothetical protein [Undibacterium aquatile]|uniref:Chemoreceptor zinc-binding protein n=1 Tax=Undibacterium aquatile TaxID=1537398 RepID=A0ABR6XFE0_9BURK|nr:hypothetical protein [Undibacterium aquatile]MBC3811315.1 hypothetical protein [Undibacterium aquatile]
MLHHSMLATIDSAAASIHAVEGHIPRKNINFSLIGVFPIKKLADWMLNHFFSRLNNHFSRIAKESASVCFELEGIAFGIDRMPIDECIDENGRIWDKLESIKQSSKMIKKHVEKMLVNFSDTQRALELKATLEQVSGVMSELYAMANHAQWKITEHDANLYQVQHLYSASSKKDAEAMLDKIMGMPG